MADLDDIRHGNDFGLGTPVASQGFHLKGSDHLDWGIKDRLSRIFRPDTGRTVMLAFDHGFIMGPTSGLERIDLSIVPIAQYADCLMATRGIVRSCLPPTLGKPMCLRADAGTTILTELNHNTVLDIEDAVRLNASALAVMVAAGDPAAEASDRGEPVPRGRRRPEVRHPGPGRDRRRQGHGPRRHSTSPWPRACARRTAPPSSRPTSATDFEKVTASCPVPIVIAGGKKLPEIEALELAYHAIDQGAAGVDMGRNVFQADAPAAMIQAVCAVVHDGLKPVDALDLYETLKHQ